MNKFTGFIILFLSIAVVMIVSPVYAQYTANVVTIATAEAVMGGTAATQMSITIRDRSDDGVTADGKIKWTGLDYLTASWEISEQYVDVDFSVSAAQWFMVLSTDNTNSAIANPEFTGVNMGDAAGLVNAGNTEDTKTLVWQIQADTEAGVGAAQISAPTGTPLAFTNTGWVWKFMLDQADSSTLTDISANTNDGVAPNYGPTTSTLPVNYYGVPYCNGVNQGAYDPDGGGPLYGDNNGRLWGGAPWERGDFIASGQRNIYFAADFAGSSLGATYRTTALKLELVVQ